jgi:murein DD-endopeptidase MepM/ murein hydrolase activator NlpD
VLITGSGPLGDLTAIWGYLDFPISQEYGHTPFSLSRPDWYWYGRFLGLDGYAHPGLDIGMPAGTPLYSPVNGTVTVSGGTGYYTFYGNGGPGVGQLSIVTDEGHEVILGHMGRITVEAGDRVSVGQFVGLSGGMNGDHLHLETRERQAGGYFRVVDPRGSFLIRALAAAAEGAEEAVEDSGTVRAIIIVRSGRCAVAADNSLTDCTVGTPLGVPFRVVDSANYDQIRKTNGEGQSRFVPVAGQNMIVEDEGLFAWYGGAYVECKVRNSDRVLYDGWVSEPAVEIHTSPGQRVDCTWYSVAGTDHQST